MVIKKTALTFEPFNCLYPLTPKRMQTHSLKLDNRMRYQHKERLKKRHATPADYKHYQLKKAPSETTHNKQQQHLNEPSTEQLHSNAHRYYDDIHLSLSDDDDHVQLQALSKLKQVLPTREDLVSGKQQLTSNKPLLNNKDLVSMSTSDLNAILLSYRDETSGTSESRTGLVQSDTSSSTSLQPLSRDTQIISPSRERPSYLRHDEEFLDSLF